MKSGGPWSSVSLLLNAAVIALVASTTLAQDYSTKPIKLDTFSSVQVCLPFDVLILPVPPGSDVGNYALVASAESSVLGAIQQDVNNGTLQLQLGGPVSSTLPVKVTVFLPATELKSVASSSGIGSLTVGGGFNVTTLNVYSAFGTANLNVFNLTAKQVNVASSGTGQIFVNGSIGSAYVAAAGTSQTYVVGLNTSANVNLGGAASAVFGFNNASGTVTGITTGSNSITSNVPSCSIQTAFLFGAPCLTQTPLTLPTISPLWSCGVNVTGTLLCPAGGLASAASSASVGVTFSTALPAFLAPSPSTASAVSSATALGPAGAAVSSVPSSPADGAVETVSPSGTTVVNVGSGFRQASASGPGSQTAIAVSGNTAANQEAALNNLVAGRKLRSTANRKLHQFQATGNAQIDALLSSLNSGSSSTSVSSSSTSNTPGSFTYTTGPGSLACAYANGQGGCQGGLLGSNNLGSGSSSSSSSSGGITPATPIATSNAANNLAGLFNTAGGGGSSNSVVSSSSSVSSGNGPSTTTTFTSGPGATATGCTSVNGVSNCQQSVNGAPAVAIPGTSFFNPLSPITVPPSPNYPTTGSRIVATTSGQSGGTSITGTTCTLPQNTTLNIFGSS